MLDTSTDLPKDAPEEIRVRAAAGPREPQFDPTLGTDISADWQGTPPHRLVVIGDSLSHGFQSGAIFNTDISYPAIIAHELGWLNDFRFPRYAGPGGLPLNIELLLRTLEERFGPETNVWEIPLALFAARSFMDDVEDYWERGPGKEAPALSAYCHNLSVYGWNLRDALSKTAASCEKAIKAPNDDIFDQVVQNNSDRAALRVYPHWAPEQMKMTLFHTAKALGEEHNDDTDCGIETLVVFLGANNALKTVTELRVTWSDENFRDPKRSGAYTIWQPEHFAAEFTEVVTAVKAIKARHVIWCTVPHVTIAPIARGLGSKVMPGSRYYPYYARPWLRNETFNAKQDKHITAVQARAVDYAIDMYNDTIEAAVRAARDGADGVERDWYLVDIAGLLDRIASRRYIEDPAARPDWWTPYPLPAPLSALDPPPDSRWLTSDGRGGRASGGLFSLDGVHPTTVGYGLIAQEMINVMRLAKVKFYHPSGAERTDTVTVDFDRLLRRDTLVRNPPQNINSTLDIIAWADEALDLIRRTLGKP